MLDKVQEYCLIIPHCYEKQKKKFSLLSFIHLHIAFCLFFKKLLEMQIKKGSLINHKSALLCTWLPFRGFHYVIMQQWEKWQRYLTNDGVWGTNSSPWDQIPFCQICFWVEWWLCFTLEQGSCVWISPGPNFLCCWKRKSFIMKDGCVRALCVCFGGWGNCIVRMRSNNAVTTEEDVRENGNHSCSSHPQGQKYLVF